LSSATDSEKSKIISYINRLHSRLNEFYEKGFKFVDKRNYKPSRPTVYVSNSPSPQGAVIGNGRSYITHQPFYDKLGGSLRYISPSNKK
jgi:hypothetical protein